MKTYYKITGENRSIFENEKFGRYVRNKGQKVEEKVVGLTYRFRCCDDDGEIYFWGVCNKYDSFQPLDWEGGDYGCTYIEYKNPMTGRYEIV